MRDCKLIAIHAIGNPLKALSLANGVPCFGSAGDDVAMGSNN